jgi:serine/threonine-protein kinase
MASKVQSAGRTSGSWGEAGDYASSSSDVACASQRQPLGELTIGTVINGKYRIDAILGKGAMGVVAACEHLELRERVALKFLRAPGADAATDFRVRFRREAQVCARLKNEHITRVVDVGVWRDAIPFMVMEHLDGMELHELLRGGRLPPALAIDYAIQICEGIAEAHSLGIVHRDLKPQNLFVTRRPDGSTLIKLLDFGISKWTTSRDHDGDLTGTGVVLGTPKYIAPEQLFATEGIDARADVWSIGAILYEMLSGRPPFDSRMLRDIIAELASDAPPRSLRAQGVDIPAELEAALFRCFERTVEHRIHDVAELAGSILDAIGSPFAGEVYARIEATLAGRVARDGDVSHSGVTGTRSSAAALPPRRTKRNVALAALAILLLVGFGAVAGSSWWAAWSHVATRAASGEETSHAVAPPPEPLAAVSAPADDPSPPSVAPTITSPEPVPEAPPTADDRAVVAIPPRRRPAPSRRAPPPAPPPAASSSAREAKSDCDPPYALTADGVKIFRPECFDSARSSP